MSETGTACARVILHGGEGGFDLAVDDAKSWLVRLGNSELDPESHVFTDEGQVIRVGSIARAFVREGS